MKTYNPVGTEAYFDTTHHGLIPGVTRGWETDSFRLEGGGVIESGSKSLLIRITKDVGPYRKGETIKSTANWIVPREAVRKPSKGEYYPRIGPYRWEGAS